MIAEANFCVRVYCKTDRLFTATIDVRFFVAMTSISALLTLNRRKL
nr:MAG TPA: hypothetical protein [Caudoviricetes sp.]